MFEILDTLFVILLGVDFTVALVLSLIIGIGSKDIEVGFLLFLVVFIAIMLFGSFILISVTVIIFPLVEALF